MKDKPLIAEAFEIAITEQLGPHSDINYVPIPDPQAHHVEHRFYLSHIIAYGTRSGPPYASLASIMLITFVYGQTNHGSDKIMIERSTNGWSYEVYHITDFDVVAQIVSQEVKNAEQIWPPLGWKNTPTY